MKTKALTAAQIDTLAHRLSETPVALSATAKKAGDNLARLLAARIGDGRTMIYAVTGLGHSAHITNA